MTRRLRTLLAVVLFASTATLARAEDTTSPETNPTATAIGEWTGSVSWNDPPINYGWQISPDGTFSSGRLGRGYSGGGIWSAEGSHVWLKYDDGFRYVGQLDGDFYSGTAYQENGRAFGTFSMWRDVKREGPAPDYFPDP